MSELVMKIKDESASIRAALLQQWLTRAKGVLHLGAHLGQEAPRYVQHNKPVIWVEAMPHIHARLAKRLEDYPGQKAFCALLGDCNGAQKTFYISNNSEGVSSSIFPFGAYGSGDRTLWPELNLAMIDTITLPMLRLDSLLLNNGVNVAEYDLWMVDLQGAELLALKGAGDLLKMCRALYVEASTCEVYEGGVLWPQLQQWLVDRGFIPLWEPELSHDDVLFVRNDACLRASDDFHSEHYLRHTQRRLEHLASLGLDLHGKTVLDVGAGIGDHTGFYLDRQCDAMVTEVRPENLVVIRKRFAKSSRVEVLQFDMDNPTPLPRQFEIVHCYGLLYHLTRPAHALRILSEACSGLLLLETCVSRGDEIAINPMSEPSHRYSQSFHGTGCRPTRPWVWQALKELMPYVYAVKTQPAHEEFPLDWDAEPTNSSLLTRAVFVCSRRRIDDNPLLLSYLPRQHAPS